MLCFMGDFSLKEKMIYIAKKQKNGDVNTEFRS